MSRYPMVPLGDVLTLDRDEVRIEPDQEYRTVGIYGFGRGLFERPTLAGTDTKYKQLFRISADQLVMSSPKAWEGAVAVVPRELDGLFVTPPYPTFRVHREAVLPTYLHWVCKWKPFWEALHDRCKGMGARRESVKVADLLATKIPLPPRAEQARIVRRLDAAHSRLRVVQELFEARVSVINAAIDHAVRRLLDSGEPQPLGEIAEVNPKPLRLGPDREIDFVPMSAVDDVTGVIESPEPRLAGELTGGYKQFRRGDVLFARITPCMQNGKAAVASITSDIGYGSTEFHVIRPSGDASAEWIYRVVRTLGFREQAAKTFTGTAGQQRVPASFLRGVTIPVPKSRACESEILSAIGDLVAVQGDARQRSHTSQSMLDALSTSLINTEFGRP